MLSKGKAAARALTRARILLKADASALGPAWPDEQIRSALDVGLATVYRLRQAFVEEGLEAALRPRQANRKYAPPARRRAGGPPDRPRLRQAPARLRPLDLAPAGRAL